MWHNGVKGNALSFDGSGNYVNVSDNDILDMSDEMTIEVFFKLRGKIDVRQTLVGKHYTEYELDIYPDGRVHTYTSDGGVSYDEGINANISDEFSEDDWIVGKWYHLTWTLNGTHEIAYVNGINIGEYDKAHSGTKAGTHNLEIGKRADPNPGLYFNGTIDEVRRWLSWLLEL